MENYLLACSDLFDLVQGGFYSVCADGYAMAYAYAYQYAQAFVNAYASSYAETHVGMILPALYINENGTEDTVFFGDPALDFAAGTLNVSCGVSSP
jgi:hypothetical protein